MERFVVLLIKDSLSIEEQDAYFGCIKVLCCCEEQKNYCDVFAPHIVPFIYERPLNVAVIGTSQSQNQKVTWNKVELNEESILKFLRSETSEKGLARSSSEETVLFQEEGSYFPDVLHSLADQLPIDGTYNCDVIISRRVLQGKNLRDHMHFAAALYRFRIWHNANISVVRENPDEDAVLTDWYEGLSSHVVSLSDVSTHGTVLWRGGLQIGLEDTMDSTYLHGFQLELQTTTEARTWSYVMEAASMKPESRSMNKCSLVVSSKLEVLDDCDPSTIPPYLMTPIVFHLSLSPCHSINEQAYQFLQHVKSKPQVAFILRLQYSLTALPLKKNTKTFDKWKEAAISGNMSTYDPELPSPTYHLNFVLSSRDSVDVHSVVAYLMKDVDNIRGDFYHSLVKSDLPFPGAELNKSCKEKVSEAFSRVPHLNVPLNTFTKAISEAQLELLQAWQNYKKSRWPEDSGVTLDEIKEIFSKVQDDAYSKLIQNMAPQEANSPWDVETAISEPVDPSDWPERKYLHQRQLAAAKKKKYNPLDTLVGLPPPAPKENTISVSAKDMMNYFTSSGEAKNRPSDAVLYKLKMKNRINVWYLPVEEALKMKWPDILQSKCHDIYYNHSNYCEDLEARCSRIKEWCVINETVSTCSSEKLSSNFIVARNHADTHLKENRLSRSDSTRGAGRGGKRKHTNYEDKYSNQKDSEAARKKLCLSARMNSCSALEQTQLKNSYKHLRSKTVDVPLRRSPRKPVRVNYKESPSRKKSKSCEAVKVAVLPDDLSEFHKKKLRNAVAIALEQYGIGLKHPEFNACGRKLFAVCKAFAKDVIGKGSTSSRMTKIAQAHAKQVVEFVTQKEES